MLAVDAAAAEAGLAPGLMLADARARLPQLRVVEADPAGDAAALQRLADWCTRFSPWTAVEGQDGIWLDITGAVPLFASEQALARELLDRLRAQGFAARVAIADTPGGAWAVARFGGLDDGLAVIPPGGVRAALGPLPVAALRLTEAITQDLRRLGLRQVASLYPLPRAPLAPRFGEIVARRLDQALGLVEEPISPNRPTEPRQERQGLAEPIGTAEAIAHVLGRLTERLCRRLEREGLGARRLELACYRVDARVERVAIGTSRPNRDAAHLSRLLGAEIERIDPGLGIEVMVLKALEVDPFTADQLGLDRGGDTAEANLAPLIDRLANRLGGGNVVRPVARASHLPERAMRLVSALESVAPGAWPEGRPRPIRLLTPPDSIEVTAPVPDDPPLLFRWRRETHRVRHAEGPERIAPEWWRCEGRADADLVEDIRDYYRVEDLAGCRFWLYRQGLYRPDVPARWFLHGFFP